MKPIHTIASFLLLGASSAFGYEPDLSRPYHDSSRDPIEDIAKASKKTLKEFENRSLELAEIQSGIMNLSIYCPRDLAPQAQLGGRLFEGRPALSNGDYYVIKTHNDCLDTGLNFISFEPVDLERNVLDIRIGHINFSPLSRGLIRTRSDYKNPRLQHELTLRVTCTHHQLGGLWTEDYFVCPLVLKGDEQSGPFGEPYDSGFVTFKVSAWNGSN